MADPDYAELLRRVRAGDRTVVEELRRIPASKPDVYPSLWDEMTAIALDIERNPAPSAGEA